MANVASLPIMLKSLRLACINTHWQSVAKKAVAESWMPEQYLAELCAMELSTRDDKRLQRHLKESDLPPGKTLSCFQFDAVTGVNTQQINALATETQWTVRGENVLIFGASGLGKTHLASSLGYSLIEAGIRVKFISATSLVQELQLAKQRYSLADALGKLDKYAVLILDDLGYVKKTDQETSVLFELIAHRYERGSLIITSNQAFSDWDHLFDDSVMTVAAIDRLVHHATIFTLEGESYRRKTSLKRKQQDQHQ
ncbi:IS21-like element helper ATPase IstB [Pusillimonas minor]|uniref:ATP-binding protein n=1 Tax=Pusillimonas minor TaxID=2697024 RepID=A0A842HSC5_9BURK|nr:ATP-binding protein [Pusillimonas minor]